MHNLETQAPKTEVNSKLIISQLRKKCKKYKMLKTAQETRNFE
jgi:hypothetical protein